MEKAVLEHFCGPPVYGQSLQADLLQDIVEETGILRQKTAEHRRHIQHEHDEIEKRLRKWQDAFEAGDKTAAALGPERVVELTAMRDDLQKTLRKVVLLRPPPPNSVHGVEDRQVPELDPVLIFLSQDNALTKNYLRFLVEKIVVNGPQVQMVTRSEAVVRMMAAGEEAAAGAAVERDPAVSPTFAVGWLRLLDSNQRPGG